MIDGLPAGGGRGRRWPPQLMGLSQMPLEDIQSPPCRQPSRYHWGPRPTAGLTDFLWLRPWPLDLVSQVFLSCAFPFLSRVMQRREDHIQFPLHIHFLLFLWDTDFYNRDLLSPRPKYPLRIFSFPGVLNDTSLPPIQHFQCVLLMHPSQLPSIYLFWSQHTYF